MGASLSGIGGQVFVFSGLDGDTLHVFNGEVPDEGFGQSIALAGDVNNDNSPDLVVGASGSIGRVFVYTCSLSVVCGDVNGSGVVAQVDLDYLINFYFMFGDPPTQNEMADVNGDGVFDLGDIVYLAQYLNNNGPAPCAASELPPLEFDPKKKPEGRQTGSNDY